MVIMKFWLIIVAVCLVGKIILVIHDIAESVNERKMKSQMRSKVINDARTSVDYSDAITFAEMTANIVPFLRKMHCPLSFVFDAYSGFGCVTFYSDSIDFVELADITLRQTYHFDANQIRLYRSGDYLCEEYYQGIRVKNDQKVYRICCNLQINRQSANSTEALNQMQQILARAGIPCQIDEKELEGQYGIEKRGTILSTDKYAHLRA